MRRSYLTSQKVEQASPTSSTKRYGTYGQYETSAALSSSSSGLGSASLVPRRTTSYNSTNSDVLSSRASRISLGEDSSTSASSGEQEVRARDKLASSSSPFPATAGQLGLRNLGNTCYFNSTLQCLFATAPLSAYILDGGYRADFVRSSNRSSSQMGSQSIVEAYVCLLKEFWGQDSNASTHSVIAHSRTSSAPLDPSRVKRILDVKSPRFRGYAQQDSHDALKALLEHIHEEIQKVKVKPKYQEMKDLAHQSLPEVADLWWNYARSWNNSEIYDIFGGQYYSAVTCNKCGNVSRAFDIFLDVNMALPSTSRCTLEDCWRNFTKKDEIDSYHCEKCKKKRKATKSVAIYRWPSVLVLQLMRFKFGSSSGGMMRSLASSSASRISTSVTFPLKSLSLAKFGVGDHGCPTYDLYAVSCHLGSTLGSGHYTSYACHAGSGRWYHFNDTHVSPVSEPPSSGSEPYVLFYRARPS